MDEQSVFLGALEKTNPDEVAQWLDANCGADQELRQRLEAMLASHQQAEKFLERPVDELMETACLVTGGEAAAAGHPSVLRSIGKRLGAVKSVCLPDGATSPEDPVVRPSSGSVPRANTGDRYQFLGEIARGGMGTVIKGRDTDLGRDLAVKVLLDDHKHKPEMIHRFVEEAQIGGQLQHPGIAPVYELGELSDQRPFFTMKLVKGKTLAALLSERETPEQDQSKLLGIFEQVCQTMAYAHSRSVIHRDLKPANIMVGAFGEVQVMDWGLAKVLQTGGVADETRAIQKPKDISVIETIRSSGSQTTDDSRVGSQTRAGSVMGTPAYMSPEQAAGEAEMLDARADVFGLGAILCEILTGQPPYLADDGIEILRMATRGDLDECKQLLSNCSANEELIALTQQCLAPNPRKRFKDAGVVADRVTEHIEAVAQKLKQAEMRRKLTYVMATALLMLIAGLGTGAVWLQVQESKAANQIAAAQKQRADEQEAANEQLQQALYASQVQLAASHLEGGRIAIADSTLESLRGEEGETDQRGFEWHYLKNLSRMPKDLGNADWADYANTFFSNGMSRSGWSAQIEPSEDGNRLFLFHRSVEPGENPLRTIKTVLLDVANTTEIWSDETSGPLLTGGTTSICMSQDGKKIATYTNQGDFEHPVHVFETVEVDSGKRTVLPAPKEPASPMVARFTFSPNGRFLAAIRIVKGLRTSAFAVWDTQEGKLLYEKSLSATMPSSGFVFSPDNTRMVTVEIDKKAEKVQSSIKVWDVVSGDEIRTIKLDANQRPALLLMSELGGLLAGQRRKAGLRAMPGCPRFSKDGRLMAVSGEQSQNSGRRSLWVWDLESGERVFSREVDTRSYKGASFSPDNKLILHHGGDVFQISDGKKLCTLGSIADMNIIDVEFSNSNSFIDCITVTGQRYRWSMPEPPAERRLGMYCVSPNGNRLTSQNMDYMAQSDGIWWRVDHSGQRSQLRLPQEDPCIIPFALTTAISDDGLFLAVSATEVARKDQRIDTPKVLQIWNTTDSSLHTTLWRPGEFEELVSVRYVPVRGWLAGVVRTAQKDKPVSDQLLFWDVESKKKLETIDIPESTCLQFSPDGEWLAVEIHENRDDGPKQTVLSIRSLDDMKEHQRLSVVPMHSRFYHYSRLAFRPGKHELAVMNRGRVDLWDLESLTIRQTLSGVDGNEAFCLDGGWLEVHYRSGAKFTG